MNNLNLLSRIQNKNVILNIRDNNCLFIDDSWSSYINWRNDYNEVIEIIKTTLLNTLVYLELNINRIDDLQHEYIEKLSLFKKSLESILLLSENNNYLKLKDIEKEIRESLRKLENLVEKQQSDSSDSESDLESEESDSNTNYITYLFMTISNGYYNIINSLRYIINIFF